jgi:Uri superfamily endonuclease
MAVHKGTYALVIALERESTVAVGKLGHFAFPPGYYVYAGSARGGLPQRVGRHLRRQKRLRWHIDYLLERAEVVEVWYAPGDERRECLWAATAREMPQAHIIAPRFGSSDCRCRSHLLYFPRRPSFTLFRQRLGEEGRQLRRATPGGFLSGP